MIELHLTFEIYRIFKLKEVTLNLLLVFIQHHMAIILIKTALQ